MGEENKPTALIIDNEKRLKVGDSLILVEPEIKRMCLVSLLLYHGAQCVEDEQKISSILERLREEDDSATKDLRGVVYATLEGGDNKSYWVCSPENFKKLGFSRQIVRQGVYGYNSIESQEGERK